MHSSLCQENKSIFFGPGFSQIFRQVYFAGLRRVTEWESDLVDKTYIYYTTSISCSTPKKALHFYKFWREMVSNCHFRQSTNRKCIVGFHKQKERSKGSSW
jgi:hypothetical protein